MLPEPREAQRCVRPPERIAQQRAAVLATQLSEADRAAAQKSAQAFKPTPLNRAANVPPEPADLAGQ